MKHMIFILILATPYFSSAQSIEKNGMLVKWEFKQNRVYFEMSAPTKGWVAIGFNNSNHITNTYLLMGNVVEKKAKVIEYYTSSPGHYNPITSFNIIPSVEDISGIESNDTTTLNFSLPLIASSDYQKDLIKNQAYFLIIAYSQSDDFEHHSIMRTSLPIKL